MKSRNFVYFAALSFTAASACAAIDDDRDNFLWLNPEAHTIYFVPADDIRSGRWETLPIDDYCRSGIKNLLALTDLPYSTPPPDLRTGFSGQALAEGRIPRLEELGSKQDVFVARVLSVTPGFSCWWEGISRRIDLEVERPVRGEYSLGSRVAIVEAGGIFEIGGRPHWKLQSPYFPVAAAGDRVLIGGHGLSEAEVSGVAVELHFRFSPDGQSVEAISADGKSIDVEMNLALQRASSGGKP